VWGFKWLSTRTEGANRVFSNFIAHFLLSWRISLDISAMSPTSLSPTSLSPTKWSLKAQLTVETPPVGKAECLWHFQWNSRRKRHILST
jgi:hypothetical protein